MKLCKYNEFILISKQLYFDDLCKALRQTHIFKTNRLTEQRGDFFVPEAGDAASNHCALFDAEACAHIALKLL